MFWVYTECTVTVTFILYLDSTIYSWVDIENIRIVSDMYTCVGEEPPQPAKVNFPRRQFSHTQSEPETSEPPPSASGLPPPRLGTLDRNVTFAEPKIKVFPPSTSTQNINPRSSILMHMHTEYTSITDELETVCGLLSPPRSPGLLSPPRPEQSPPSMSLV